MAMTAALFLAAPDLLGRAFTNDAGVVRVAALLLPIAGVFQIFDGLQAVSAGALRGAGDTRGPMLANLLGFWSFGLPLSLLLTFRLDWGPAGLWWGLAAGPCGHCSPAPPPGPDPPRGRARPSQGRVGIRGGPGRSDSLSGWTPQRSARHRSRREDDGLHPGSGLGWRWRRRASGRASRRSERATGCIRTGWAGGSGSSSSRGRRCSPVAGTAGSACRRSRVRIPLTPSRLWVSVCRCLQIDVRPSRSLAGDPSVLEGPLEKTWKGRSPPGYRGAASR